MVMSTRKSRLIATGALAVLVLGMAAVAMNSIYASASSKVTVRTTTVQRGTVSSTVSATGNVAPAAALSVNFGTGGIVTAINVKTGDHVTAGQPLATLDDTQT
jgi:macrolide-specific efflux system membrane fusion protein